MTILFFILGCTTKTDTNKEETKKEETKPNTIYTYPELNRACQMKGESHVKCWKLKEHEP